MLAVVGAGYLALLGSLVVVPMVKDHLNRTDFDADAWGDPQRVRQRVRIRMVDDLLRKHDFHGKTAESVVGFLGPPDDTAYFDEQDLVYWLGPERHPFSIDSELLVFRLDDRGEVVEYRIVTD